MKTLPCGCGRLIMIDDADFDWLSTKKWGCINKYPHYYENAEDISMSRLIMGALNHEEVDHKDRDTHNNQRENLRLATGSQNMANKQKQPSNTSGYKGVFFTRKGLRKPWRSQVQKLGYRVNVGYYATAIEAAVAYDKAAKELFGEFALLNFPEDFPRIEPITTKLTQLNEDSQSNDS